MFMYKLRLREQTINNGMILSCRYINYVLSHAKIVTVAIVIAFACQEITENFLSTSDKLNFL